MPKKRMPMNKIKETLRLRYECNLSNRQIAACLNIAHSTVSQHLSRFKSSGLTWPLEETHHENQVTQALFDGRSSSQHKVMPDFTLCYLELKRKGMTKALLWEEYCHQHQAKAYGYTQFCELYRRWLKTQKRSMRQLHHAGDKLFIDYCGPTIPVVNPDTGECRHAQVFVATLGASNYTYVEASESQGLEHFLMAHVNTFNHFGGAPNLLVPDNLKSAVTKADCHSPILNESYRKLAQHYGVAVMPARPYKPKDKAKAENAVLIVERWIMMRLRHQVFYTMAELNLAIRKLMHDLNQREMKQLGVNRHDLFNKVDRPALKPLPSQPYVYIETKRATVSPDYHIQYKKHFYSVPHQLVGQQVELEATHQIIRIYHKGSIVAHHCTSQKEYGLSTVYEHMPSNHQYQSWTPERFIRWGKSIGPATGELTQMLLKRPEHEALAFRSCFGLLSLAKKHSDARLEQACRDALVTEKPYLGFVKNLLKNHREGTLSQPSTDTPNLKHTNVRGSNYYH
ncbi:IS21 family transposase [Vibrio chagasii]|uniref:IS21 family transposase n=1 Tax=Vibrio chagasii TaxID=170679 RepID=UPI002284157A|nr:IS21 family transposase [Vibrio chagasii]MCY9829194.1 IS21 family transposase [Vibrio chagasii]